jgi:uncharacterized protein (TIGR02996 family)
MTLTDRNDHDTFLRAIQAAPEEDAPRLIYADWLEEMGESAWLALAELIRVQVELVGKVKKSKRRKAELQRQEQERLARASPEWLGTWATPTIQWIFRRGLPDRFQAIAAGIENGDRPRVTFHEDGTLRVTGLNVPEGQRYIYYRRTNYGDEVRSLELTWLGSYRLHFTYAQVSLTLEIWNDPNTWPHMDRRFQGTLRRTDTGLVMDVQEEMSKRKPLGDRLTWEFVAPRTTPAIP